MRRNGCQGRSEDEARTVELFRTDAKGEVRIRKVRRNKAFFDGCQGRRRRKTTDFLKKIKRERNSLAEQLSESSIVLE